MAWTLGGVIREQARRRRDAPMITYGARTITWSEMDARASRVAQASGPEIDNCQPNLRPGQSLVADNMLGYFTNTPRRARGERRFDGAPAGDQWPEP